MRLQSDDFSSYVRDLNGNAFAKENAIGLGCIENNRLSYVNDSDELGMKGYNLSESDTSILLNSSQSNPITLELEKLQYTSGRGAPKCYSHITYVKVVK